MLEHRIIPSIIAGSQEEVEQRINYVKDAAKWLQLDVMDGKFVPTHSLDFDFTLPETKCRYEAHLMLAEPNKWIEKHWQKADTILFHVDTDTNVQETIDLIKSKGKKTGIAIRPETPVSKIEKYLDLVEEVLVMTVEPGYYGAKFLPETMEKVKQLRQLKPSIDIEVDGSINAETIGQASKAGANFFISGSYIMKANDPKKAIESLEALQK